jgi:hypothetical protein
MSAVEIRGVRLDREQSLRVLAALDASREPTSAEEPEWARRVLGLPAGTT